MALEQLIEKYPDLWESVTDQLSSPKARETLFRAEVARIRALKKARKIEEIETERARKAREKALLTFAEITLRGHLCGVVAVSCKGPRGTVRKDVRALDHFRRIFRKELEWAGIEEGLDLDNALKDYLEEVSPLTGKWKNWKDLMAEPFNGNARDYFSALNAFIATDPRSYDEYKDYWQPDVMNALYEILKSAEADVTSGTAPTVSREDQTVKEVLSAGIASLENESIRKVLSALLTAIANVDDNSCNDSNHDACDDNDDNKEEREANNDKTLMTEETEDEQAENDFINIGADGLGRDDSEDDNSLPSSQENLFVADSETEDSDAFPF